MRLAQIDKRVSLPFFSHHLLCKMVGFYTTVLGPSHFPADWIRGIRQEHPGPPSFRVRWGLGFWLLLRGRICGKYLLSYNIILHTVLNCVELCSTPWFGIIEHWSFAKNYPTESLKHVSVGRTSGRSRQGKWPTVCGFGQHDCCKDNAGISCTDDWVGLGNILEETLVVPAAKIQRMVGLGYVLSTWKSSIRRESRKWSAVFFVLLISGLRPVPLHCAVGVLRFLGTACRIRPIPRQRLIGLHKIAMLK